MPTEFNLADSILPKELKFISNHTFKNGYLWKVEKIRNPFEVCPKCATPSSVQAGKAYARVREAPLREKPLWLHITKHRYYCKTCKKPFTEPVSEIWPRRRSTAHFRKAVANDCNHYVNMSLVRKHHSCSSGFMYKVHYDALCTRLRDRCQTKWPDVLGIDEHFFTRRRGYAEFATVFCDLRKRRLFEICKGKDKSSITSLVENYRFSINDRGSQGIC